MEGLLVIDPDTPPDYYLVFTGPIGSATSSRETARPWLISFVYLFDAGELMGLIDRDRFQPGTATNIAKQIWQEAELFPEQRNDMLALSAEQQRLLRLFSPL